MNAIGHRIVSVSADVAAKTLIVVWDDGSTTVKAMAPLIGTRKVFNVLGDPSLFARVRVIDDGRALAWDDETDVCADALWLEAHPEQNPFIRNRTAA